MDSRRAATASHPLLSLPVPAARAGGAALLLLLLLPVCGWGGELGSSGDGKSGVVVRRS